MLGGIAGIARRGTLNSCATGARRAARVAPLAEIGEQVGVFRCLHCFAHAMHGLAVNSGGFGAVPEMRATNHALDYATAKAKHAVERPVFQSRMVGLARPAAGSFRSPQIGVALRHVHVERDDHEEARRFGGLRV